MHPARRVRGRIPKLTGLALAVLVILPSTAHAVPPRLDAVGYGAAGVATARYTLALDSTDPFVEVATAPDTQPDGSFVRANVVDSDDLFDDEETWKSEKRIGPGTYYVHLRATSRPPCGDPDPDSCPEVTEWSEILTLVIPPPLRGKYVGKTFFGERISFIMSSDGKTVVKLTVDYALDCSRAPGLGIIRVRFPPIAVQQDLDFREVLKLKQGGLRLTFTVAGTLTLRGKASGGLRARGSVRGLGKCRSFGDPDWSVRRR